MDIADRALDLVQIGLGGRDLPRRRINASNYHAYESQDGPALKGGSQ